MSSPLEFSSGDNRRGLVRRRREGIDKAKSGDSRDEEAFKKRLASLKRKAEAVQVEPPPLLLSWASKPEIPFWRGFVCYSPPPPPPPFELESITITTNCLYNRCIDLNLLQ